MIELISYPSLSRKLTSRPSVATRKPPLAAVQRPLNPTESRSKINTLPVRKQPSSTIEAGSDGNRGYIAQTGTFPGARFPNLDEIFLMDGEEQQLRKPEQELVPGQPIPEESSRLMPPHEKVRTFPTTPGVYLMKDAQGRVIYVGKAVNLRSRAGSYFTKAAEAEFRTAKLIPEIADIDYIDADSEVDALLIEARLIKDIQPRFNAQLKDDKTFPYLQISTREDFPRVEFTRQPETSGVKLYGPFTSAGQLRGTIAVLQRIFRFRTCTLDIAENDERWRWFRPCLLASINQCTAPCNLRISKAEYREDIRRLRVFLDGGKASLLKEMETDMLQASKELKFEKAARIRDEIESLKSLSQRGDLESHAQPEVFYIDPQKGLAGLKKVLKLQEVPRRIEGVDIAHLQGHDTVASLVQFIDGLPFKPGYKRYRIQSVEGVDDFASMREVITRRFRRLTQDGESFPDLLLIDGGKGQLSAVMETFAVLNITPPTTISLAKREEEIYVPGEPDPLRLSRHAFSLRLLQYVRDEAHRFAQHYHHTLRHKTSFDSGSKKQRRRNSET
jgi:excinuclease ABC subunit C